MKQNVERPTGSNGNTLVSKTQFKPMLFSTNMVEAILSGKKTQTRRIITDANSRCTAKIGELDFNDYIEDSFFEPYYLKVARPSDKTRHRVFPRNQIGTILWVRETWRKTTWLHPGDEFYGYVYKASENGREWESCDESWIWKPSIFMPKDACRLFLEVTDLRAERLQNISEQDAIAEGVINLEGTILWYNYIQDRYTCGSAIKSYKTLWEKINGVESLEENLIVWVATFAIVEYPQGFC